MGDECSSHERGEIHKNFSTKTEMRENLEDLEAEGEIIVF